MNHHLETIPTTWSDADERFFAVVKRVLPPQFLYGAGVLLASYDDEVAPLRAASASRVTSVASTPQVGVQALPR